MKRSVGLWVLSFVLLDAACRAQVPAESRPESHPAQVVTGRVVGEGRFPAAGIPVGVFTRGRQPIRGVTDAGGRFRLSLAGWDEDDLWRASVRAFGTGATAAGRTFEDARHERRRRGTGDLDVGTLPLLTAFRVSATVVSAGQPVPGAHVTLEAHDISRLGFVEEVVTNTAGVATFDGVVAHEFERSFEVRAWTTDGRVGSSWIESQLTPDTRIPVEVAPARSVRVTVIDDKTGAPIAGVIPHVSLERRTADGFNTIYGLAAAIRPTGADGVTTIGGLSQSESVRMSVSTANQTSDAVENIQQSEAITVRLEQLQPQRWPITADSETRPAAGTPLVLSETEEYASVKGVAAAVSDGGVVTTAGRIWGAVMATAPDGSFAVIGNWNQNSGARFVRPRHISVTLAWDDGSPAVGLRVCTSWHHGWPSYESVTDRDGRATIVARSTEEIRVFVEGDRWSLPIGEVDLAAGDGTIAATIPRPVQVTLHVTLDGARRLPADLNVYAREGTMTAVAENPADATLAFGWFPPHANAGQVELSGDGFSTEKVFMPETKSGSSLTRDVALVSGILLSIDVMPAENIDTPKLQRWDEATARWVEGPYVHLPRKARTTLRASGVPPGVYRFAEETGPLKHEAPAEERGPAASETFMIAPGDKTKHVTLDLTKRLAISGRIEVPEGADLAQAGVVPVDPQSAEPVEKRRVRDGVPVRANGTFKFLRLGAPAVTLQAWHPALDPAAEGGTVTFHERTRDAILRLASAERVARFSCDHDLPSDFPSHGAVRVLLFRGEAVSRPVTERSAVFVDGALQFNGFAPGVYTVVIDPPAELEYDLSGVGRIVRLLPGRCPAVIEGARLEGTRTDLGRVAFSRGSTLRVKLDDRWGSPKPALVLTAEALDEPRYIRRLHSAGESELVLSGLRKGRFRISLAHESVREPCAAQVVATVEADGEHEVILGF